MDLTEYRELRFQVRTDHPGTYTVRIENPIHKYESTNVAFEADETTRLISIPLSAFATGVDKATVLVWRPGEEVIGAPFHLVLDDVQFVK
jgi:hypothetical protein